MDGLVLALDDREGVHDVVDFVTVETVEGEEGRVQLGTEENTALVVPAVRGAVEAVVGGEVGHVM
ncbi:hypothetical protein ACFOOM_03895 [Streptomyces echinoruber]|uniref:Uncharacterized protein n=1 Tax=Streptomyces echinoruber TaxID=68898 RepID=A0A918QW18_9ACTN|nr:hypothetical protein [Streptomyces echinoruber]GGZ70965.1 hypothetical protein GCM10010389_05580 [Streptomyces echinoruber]